MYAQFRLRYIYAQTDVTLSVERATLDADGNPGIWSPVTLKTALSGGDNFAWPTLDVLDNPNPSGAIYGYDQTLPATAASYQYRVKAVKGGQTDYLISNTVTVDPYSYFTDYVSLSVANYTTGSR